MCCGEECVFNPLPSIVLAQMKTGFLIDLNFRRVLNLVQCPTRGEETSGKVGYNVFRPD